MALKRGAQLCVRPHPEINTVFLLNGSDMGVTPLFANRSIFIPVTIVESFLHVKYVWYLVESYSIFCESIYRPLAADWRGLLLNRVQAKPSAHKCL